MERSTAIGSDKPVSEVTRLILAARDGDKQAAEVLLPLVYDELRRLAAARMERERSTQTLDATALVHEAYLRLVGDQQFEGRGHFFSAAAEAMRRILVERARRRRANRHGGKVNRLELEPHQLAAASPDDELLALHEALDRLALVYPEKAELVKLRFFAGMSADEAASTLGISPSTADRHWSFARAWLGRAMSST